MKTKFGALLAMALMAACSGGGGEEKTDVPQALVDLGTVTRGEAMETVTLYGQVEVGPKGRDVLFTPIEARLADIEQPVGSMVEAGQVVVRLQPGPEARLAIQQAQSDAAAAEKALARAKRLKADGLGSDAEVDSARATRDSSRALLESLIKRQGELALKAPARAVVEGINGRPGDLLPSGTAVLTLVRQNADMRARFGADPALTRMVNIKDRILVQVPGKAKPLTTFVVSIDPVVDPQTRLASIYVSIPDGVALAPGEAVTGSMLVRHATESLIVPYGALLDDAGQPFVYVVVDGVAKRHDVRTGVTDGQSISVLDGVKEGDQVVIDGGTALEDGMRVRVKK